MLEHPKLDRNAKQIRLLTVVEGSTKDSLEFRLETTDLEVRPFIALSYTWGSSTLVKDKHGNVSKPLKWELKDDPSIPITVNSSVFLITPNLHYFLQEIALSKLPEVPFYVDQICINQEDVDEKGHQVALMGQIYSKATEVIAWLPPNELESLEAVSSFCQNVELQSFLQRPESRDKLDNYPGMTASELKYLVTGIGDLSRSVYWSRQWILQEILLAKRLTLQVGEFHLDWDIMFNLIVNRYSPELREIDTAVALTSPEFHQSEFISDGFAYLSGAAIWRYKDAIKQRYEGEVLKSLAFVLPELGNRFCKHQRDKIFSLLSLTKSALEPDYRKPLGALFIEVLALGLTDFVARKNEGRSDIEDFYVDTVRFVATAVAACGFGVPTMTVLLIIRRTMQRCGLSKRSRVEISKEIWMLNVLGSIPERLNYPRESRRSASYHPPSPAKNKSRMSYLFARMKLRHARVRNLSLELPEVDHQTGQWRTISKRCSDWVQYVDDVLAGTTLSLGNAKPSETRRRTENHEQVFLQDGSPSCS